MKTLKIFVLACIGITMSVGVAVGWGQTPSIRMIDGVKHIQNSEKPFHGTVSLEVERVREIDPYEQPEFGLRFFSQARDDEGNVILFGDGEAHRFAKDGRYLGLLFRKGQGPGEFSGNFIITCKKGEFWVSDHSKLARFDKKGKLLNEKKLGQWGDYFLDESRFFETKHAPDARSVVLMNFRGPGDPLNEAVVFFQAKVAGMHRDPGTNRGFSAVWVTPDILYTVDTGHGVFYGMVNNTYRIEVKDLDGRLRHIIEKPFRRIQLSREEKEKMLFIRAETDKWKLRLCPDEMVVAYGFHVLPKGYIGVQRFISPSDSELDVYDPEGRFVYVLRHPDGVPFDRVDFHESGFCSVLRKGDGFVYADFKVKNFPALFQRD